MRAMRETSRDETIMALGRGTEKADPTSGDGVGETSCAETVAAAANITIAKRIIVAFTVLTWAMFE